MFSTPLLSQLVYQYRTFQFPGEPPMTRFFANAVAKSHWFDISTAEKDLEYKPKVPMEEGLRRLEDWLKIK